MDTAAPGRFALAEALRREEFWDAAAAAYTAHLAQRPEDWRARLALGDCALAADDVAGALLAYEEAERLAPNAAEVAARLATAWEREGDLQAALAAWRRAQALDPDAPGPASRLRALAHLAPPAAAPGADAALHVVFDASDLIQYFRSNRAPTGIQRVQLNVIARALEAPEPGLAVAVTAFESGHGFWREIPRALFLRLWHLSRIGADAAEPVWCGAMEEVGAALSEGLDYPFPPGAWLVNLGTSWWIRDYFPRVRHIQRSFGVRYVPFVHDCIPLIVPEHCAAGLVREFVHWFASLALHADAILVNSECTGADVRRLAAAVAPDHAAPMAVVKLDADMRSELPSARGRRAQRVAGLPRFRRPYVLFVGTLETRKDHLLVFRAWRELMRRHGELNVPRLICVGKHGWLAEGALELHRATPALRRRVALVQGVSDTLLAALYEDSLFSVYNSHYEGWGLPVTESLSYGKVAVVPRVSSLPEAGGEGAVYFAPQDLDDLVGALDRMMFDRRFRRDRERALAERVRLRSWAEIEAQVLAELRRFAATDTLPLERRLMVEPGEPYDMHLAGSGAPTHGMAVADMVRDGPGWFPLEAWGVWTRPGLARLRLPVPEALAGRRVALRLDLLAPPGGSELRLRAVPAAGPAGPFHALTLGASDRAGCALEAAGEGGAIDVEIDGGDGAWLGPPGSKLRRRVGVGVLGFMLAEAGDVVAAARFRARRCYPERLLR